MGQALMLGPWGGRSCWVRGDLGAAAGVPILHLQRRPGWSWHLCWAHPSCSGAGEEEAERPVGHRRLAGKDTSPWKPTLTGLPSELLVPWRCLATACVFWEPQGQDCGLPVAAPGSPQGFVAGQAQSSPWVLVPPPARAPSVAWALLSLAGPWASWWWGWVLAISMGATVWIPQPFYRPFKKTSACVFPPIPTQLSIPWPPVPGLSPSLTDISIHSQP